MIPPKPARLCANTSPAIPREPTSSMRNTGSPSSALARANWPKPANMWQTYYATHKDSPNALRAIYEIATAYRRLGRPEEAQKLMAEHIAPNLGNPKNEQVELLIQQLVGMIIPKKRGRPAASA